MQVAKPFAVVGALFTVGVALAAAQNPSPPRVALPASVALTDVQITLRTGGGCLGRCVHYRVTIHGDGTVKYEELAKPPIPPQARTVTVADVVALTNEFIGARFFEAAARYVGRNFYVLEGERLSLLGRSVDDGPEWDLSLRLGDLEKSVHLNLDYPEQLGRLRDRVDQIGGPQSWIAK